MVKIANLCKVHEVLRYTCIYICTGIQLQTIGRLSSLVIYYHYYTSEVLNFQILSNKKNTKNNSQYCDPVKLSVIKMICIQNQLFRVGHTFCNLFCGKKSRQLSMRQERLVAETPLIKISSSFIADVFKKYKHLGRCKVCGGIEYKTRRQTGHQ